MLRLLLTTFCFGLALSNPLPLRPRPRDGYKIPSTSFNSQTTFNSYWKYNYPWGNTHNGAARMDSAHVAVGNGQLTLTADYVTGQAPTSSGIAINYLSGTVYAQESYAVAVGGGYSFTGQFLAPTIKGTWPAFWLTGVNTWPPEIDLAEWKGDGDISFNTYGMNSVWITDNVPYSSSSFQTLTMDVMDLNGKFNALIQQKFPKKKKKKNYCSSSVAMFKSNNRTNDGFNFERC
jgi:hypothetical protein